MTDEPVIPMENTQWVAPAEGKESIVKDSVEDQVAITNRSDYVDEQRVPIPPELNKHAQLNGSDDKDTGVEIKAIYNKQVSFRIDNEHYVAENESYTLKGLISFFGNFLSYAYTCGKEHECPSCLQPIVNSEARGMIHVGKETLYFHKECYESQNLVAFVMERKKAKGDALDKLATSNSLEEGDRGKGGRNDDYNENLDAMILVNESSFRKMNNKQQEDSVEVPGDVGPSFEDDVESIQRTESSHSSYKDLFIDTHREVAQEKGAAVNTMEEKPIVQIFFQEGKVRNSNKDAMWSFPGIMHSYPKRGQWNNLLGESRPIGTERGAPLLQERPVEVNKNIYVGEHGKVLLEDDNDHNISKNNDSTINISLDVVGKWTLSSILNGTGEENIITPDCSVKETTKKMVTAEEFDCPRQIFVSVDNQIENGETSEQRYPVERAYETVGF